MRLFANRIEAGRLLAEQLTDLRGEDLVVLGLPRGGVPVAAQVARALDAPLDVIVVRKLGVPFQPELAMGAIGEMGTRVLDETLIRHAGITLDEVRDVEDRERAELERRVARLRRGRPRVPLEGRVAVVVDDGLATGSTARVACQVARQLGARRVVLAVPVAPADSVREGIPAADQIVCVRMPEPFVAVGRHYDDFTPTSDEEVIVALDQSARRLAMSGSSAEPPDCDLEVEIPVGQAMLEGHLHLPEPARAMVVFAHGSGSSRHSPRNRFVASVLYEAGIGTLLLDLLTPIEEMHRSNVFDIQLLARRLLQATEWLADRPEARAAPIGYFGASTGAGAALWAAAAPGADISAVVSRGGRPDLAGSRLSHVRAPDAPHRRRSRRDGHRSQPTGTEAADLRERPRGGRGCHPSLRGARDAGRGGAARPRLVQPSPARGSPGTRRAGRAMSPRPHLDPMDAVATEIRALARPLATPADLDPLLARTRSARYVCIGEASHGTHEYYRWRAELSRRLIEEQNFTWIGVEGDWPDCWRINRWVRGLADQDLDARELLDRFERWPTWMWANTDVAEFLDWLRERNTARPAADQVGFYGLDVYSLWDSLRVIMDWLTDNAPDALADARRAWQCFAPFGEDPHEYAWSTRLVPETCEGDVVGLLVSVRARTRDRADDDEGAFDAEQNAEVAVGAERYYRVMIRGDRQSWNVRDHHMADTIDRLAAHLGPRSKGLIWEHNTHVGDAQSHLHGRRGPGQRGPARAGAPRP